MNRGSELQFPKIKPGKCISAFLQFKLTQHTPMNIKPSKLTVTRKLLRERNTWKLEEAEAEIKLQEAGKSERAAARANMRNGG